MSHFSTLCKSHENIMHSQILRCWVPNSAMLSLQRTKFSYQEILLLIFFSLCIVNLPCLMQNILQQMGGRVISDFSTNLVKPAEFQSYTSTIKKSPRCVSNKLFFFANYDGTLFFLFCYFM